MPKKGEKGRPGGCKVCSAPAEVRGKVDYLLAAGEPVRSVARQFNLPYHSCWRHAHPTTGHISQQYRRAVQLGAHRSEEEFRKLCAEEGTSVVQNLRAVYSGLLSRWLLAIESGNDQAVIGLSRELHANLRMRGQAAHELSPGGASITVNNVVFSPGWLEGFGRDLMALGLAHPDVRPALVALLNRRMAFSAEPETATVVPLLEAQHD